MCIAREPCENLWVIIDDEPMALLDLVRSAAWSQRGRGGKGHRTAHTDTDTHRHRQIRTHRHRHRHRHRHTHTHRQAHTGMDTAPPPLHLLSLLPQVTERDSSGRPRYVGNVPSSFSPSSPPGPRLFLQFYERNDVWYFAPSVGVDFDRDNTTYVPGFQLFPQDIVAGDRAVFDLEMQLELGVSPDSLLFVCDACEADTCGDTQVGERGDERRRGPGSCKEK